jgi:hypothetical protein
MTMNAQSMRRFVVMAALCSLGVIAPATAQTSASFKLQESSINNGGDPRSGAPLASAHFHLSLDAIGDGVLGSGLSSASFHADAGFAGRYAPAGEVTGQRFVNATTMQWNAASAAARYEVYRGTISSLPGTFGACFAPDLLASTVPDASTPSSGSGFFYFVTTRNRLGEEGTKGYRSDGTERANPLPCP